jgi:CheY-like chemotaxis protein
MAQVYQWVRQWGGDMAVSTRLPQGSVFQIFLPRVGELTEAPVSQQTEALPEPKPAPVEPPAPVEKSKTILVVSEESGIRTLLSKMLRRESYRVLEATGLDDTLKQSAEQAGQLKLLIADASLPRITDSHSIAQLQRSSPGIKLLFLTELGESDQPKTLPEGTEYLQKPFTLKALVSKAKELLAPST